MFAISPFLSRNRFAPPGVNVRVSIHKTEGYIRDLAAPLVVLASRK